MLKGRLIFTLSWNTFAWANFVIGALVLSGLTRGWEVQIPANRAEWLLVCASTLIWFLLYMVTGRASILPRKK